MRKLFCLFIIIAFGFKILSAQNDLAQARQLVDNNEFNKAISALSKLNYAQMNQNDSTEANLLFAESYLGEYIQFKTQGVYNDELLTAGNFLRKVQPNRVQYIDEFQNTTAQLSQELKLYIYNQLVNGNHAMNTRDHEIELEKLAMHANVLVQIDSLSYMSHDMVARVAMNQDSLLKTIQYCNNSIRLYAEFLPHTADYLEAYTYYTKAYAYSSLALTGNYQGYMDEALVAINSGLDFIKGEFQRSVETNELSSDDEKAYNQIMSELKNYQLDLLLKMPWKREEAIQAFDETGSGKLDNETLLSGYAYLMEKKDPEKAIRAYQEGVKKFPASELLYYNFGIFLFNSGADAVNLEKNNQKGVQLFSESLFYLQKAYELNPVEKNKNALLSCAQILKRQDIIDQLTKP